MEGEETAPILPVSKKLEADDLGGNGVSWGEGKDFSPGMGASNMEAISPRKLKFRFYFVLFTAL